MPASTQQHQGLLKKALTGNAVFSVVSGTVILLANRWLVRFLGLPDQVSLAILGFSLLGYALLLWRSARRPRIKLTDAWIAVIMDVVWVVGSVALLAAVPFSTGGKTAVASVADLVLAFAILQWLGIRRVRKGEQHA